MMAGAAATPSLAEIYDGVEFPARPRLVVEWMRGEPATHSDDSHKTYYGIFLVFPIGSFLSVYRFMPKTLLACRT
jgi:hypothetical protein